ncbi:MAG: hypothetical protein M1816_007801 [Peltula sp. TS41687]|nr:MAG: hypothetical protein M1816_007801 [Peltula sp. TS41687]
MSAQDEIDDFNIQQLLSGLDPSQQGGFDFLGRDLETGEKAEDAVDYGDIDDDDLADDEDMVDGPSNEEKVQENGSLEDFTQATTLLDAIQTFEDDVDLDDLFGDIPSSPTHPDEETNDVDHEEHHGEQHDPGISLDDGIPVSSSIKSPEHAQDGASTPTNTEPLFRAINYNTSYYDSIMPPAPPENPEEALAAMWPKYRRDEVPKFIELLPPKKARYIGKTPLKPPKPLILTKVNLEIAPDQETAFRRSGLAAPTTKELELEAEEKGLVLFADQGTESEEDEDEDLGPEEGYDGEMIGATNWNDIRIACADWNTPIAVGPSDSGIDMSGSPHSETEDLFTEAIDDWEEELDEPSAKRQKTGRTTFSLKPIPTWGLPPLDDPERATAKIARKVTLDLNDPELLIDFQERDATSKPVHRLGGDFKRGVSSSLTKSVLQRYNISNDEAYDLLKENHQNKVRSMLGNLTIEHSMPALRHQYPYYKVKLARQEARSFHRPAMNFMPNSPIRFSMPKTLKRKRLRGKDTQSIFNNTRDLSLADNSNVLLLEYSEEYPTMMSNFGMGSRVVNYYRRKDMEDNARPKLDVGETAVLMPQDKSPFSAFGSVDPGEMVPTLHTAMFRAPIFKQEVPSSDFLVIRNTTGVEGSSWYMRNVENLYLVGQQLPSVEVPGPQSRKVTTASKSRLKMISFRKMKKNKSHQITIGEVTKHFPDTTDLQNRQKLKEFMQFNKEQKVWEMRPGETIPDESIIRGILKPEDICLLEASQVGSQHLQDAGYGKDAEDVDMDEDDGREGQSLEQQLAPWRTTRNFLDATQGKAMLQLHGEGDPTGRGEAFSFIRTSMKGGFKAFGESIEDKIDAKRLKELGGHTYNVAKQQKAYEDSIRKIWEAQKSSLSSTEIPFDDSDVDEDAGDAPDDLFEEGKTPRSDTILPSAFGHRGDDETASQFSKFSATTQGGKVLRITREYNNNGNVERVTEIVRDPRVIRQYIKSRLALEAENTKLSDLQPTGDPEQDRRNVKRIENEIGRIRGCLDRRDGRVKLKAAVQEGPVMSPTSPGSPPAATNSKGTGTLRKCANCGQVGHIKTNKKLCPLLNGSMSQGGLQPDGLGAMGAPPLA